MIKVCLLCLLSLKIGTLNQIKVVHLHKTKLSINLLVDVLTSVAHTEFDAILTRLILVAC